MTSLETLQAGLTHLHQRGTFEIRCIDVDGGGARRVATPTEAIDLNAKGWNVYHTVNRVRPDLKDGSASDQDIIQIRWIPYDVDPVRRDAQGNVLNARIHSSTDAEKESAGRLADQIVNFWAELGLDPTIMDTGNGWLVLVPTELPPEDYGLVQRLLAGHARQFDTADAHIDTVVFNLSRILAAPGTIKRKGPDTAERPHRPVEITRKGSLARLAKKDLLTKILDDLDYPEPEFQPDNASGGGVSKEWMESFLKRHKIRHGPMIVKKDRHGQDLRLWKLDHTSQSYCPNRRNHTSPDLEGAQAVFVTVDGKAGYHCCHTHCEQVTWRDFRAQFDRTPPKDQTRPGDFPNIGELMVLTETRKPRCIVANAITALEYSQEWAGVLAYDEFAQRTVVKKPTPWPKAVGSEWSDTDDIRAAEWLQRMPKNAVFVSPQVAGQAVEVIARQNGFHPVRSYVQSLVWDGTPRLDTWLIDYLGVKDTPFVRAVGAKWLLSAIARVSRPGCQADHTLLLEGPQGIRKSTELRVLAGDEWFTDHISALGSKDSRGDLLGKWIVEISELSAMRRADLETIKAFLTARIDHFRKPYARRSEDVPRQCVFAATTNDETPFHDQTGNRRFWPVRCGKIDVNGLRQDRDQLWAEAYRRYQEGEIWWLEDADLERRAREEQDQRYEPGPWDEKILGWVEEPEQRNDEDGLPVAPITSDRDRITTIDILIHAIGKPLDRITPLDQHQVTRCLTHNGWRPLQIASAGRCTVNDSM